MTAKLHVSVLCLVAVVSVLACQAAAEPAAGWPAWRGPNGDGKSAKKSSATAKSGSKAE